jgi:hypothetical protein
MRLREVRRYQFEVTVLNAYMGDVYLLSRFYSVYWRGTHDYGVTRYTRAMSYAYALIDPYKIERLRHVLSEFVVHFTKP